MIEEKEGDRKRGIIGREEVNGRKQKDIKRRQVILAHFQSIFLQLIKRPTVTVAQTNLSV